MARIFITEEVKASGDQRQYCDPECTGLKDEACTHFGELRFAYDGVPLRREECCMGEALHTLAGGIKQIIEASKR
jgi:hypothetical protein